MANNTQLNPGNSGDVIATVDIGTFTAYPTTGKAPTGVLYFSTSTGVVPAPVTNANPLGVNVAQVGAAALALGQGTMAGSLPVTIASNQSNLPANVTQISGTALTLGQKAMASSVPVALASDQSAIPVSQSGTWNATINTALPTGTNTIGAVTVPATSTGGKTIGRQVPSTSAGILIKTGATQLFGFYALNYQTTTASAYLKLYDLASAPTTGTSAVTASFHIPPTNFATVNSPAGLWISFGDVTGLQFTNGLGIAVTGALADADTSAPPGQVILDFVYK